MYLLAELVPVVPTGLAEKPPKRGPAIVANEVLGEEPPRHAPPARALPGGPPGSPPGPAPAAPAS
eukprot:15003461-Alexandrium_andersonii.AAC.1